MCTTGSTARAMMAGMLVLLMSGGTALAQRGGGEGAGPRGSGEGGQVGQRGEGPGARGFEGRAGQADRRGIDRGALRDGTRGIPGEQQRGRIEGFRGPGQRDRERARDFAPGRALQDGRREFQTRRPPTEAPRTDRFRRDFQDRQDRFPRDQRDVFRDRDRAERFTDRFRDRDFRDRDVRDRDFRDRDFRDRDFRDRDFRDQVFRDRDIRDRDFRDRIRDRTPDRLRDERERVREIVRRDERARDERDWTGRWQDRERDRVGQRIRDRWRDRDRLPFVAGWWVGPYHHPWGFWGDYGPVRRNPWFWWTWATAPRLATWLTFGWPTHYYWDYGPGEYIFYRDGAIFVNNQWYQPAPVYYERTVRLIEDTPVPRDEEQAAQLEWQPLGVFAATLEGRTEADVVVQLAVTQEGLLGGTAYDQRSDEAYPVEGAVDEETQRAVWSFTDAHDRRIVMETSFFNLTLPHASGLIAYGPDDMEVIQLVRLEPPEDADVAAAERRAER